MASSRYRDEWKTTPNIITMVRIVFIPVFVVALLAPWPEWFFATADSYELSQYINEAIKPWAAAAIYAVLALTDGIDGYIARKYNQITAVGKFLDPIADKVLVSAALLALIELGDLPSWVVLVIIAREFIVSGLRMIAAADGVVVAARMSGKVKTALTLVAILLFIIKRSSLAMQLSEGLYMALYAVSWLLMALALIMTVVSMFQYFKQVFTADAAVQEEREEEALATELPYGELAEQVLGQARERGVHLATAESCTGGLIGALLTAIPGSSDIYEGGAITYSYEMKERELGVSHETLQSVGAVSSEVALQMAEGARSQLLGAFDEQHALAVSVTGVAGPGQSEGKPAGTVWFGISGLAPAETRCVVFEGDRASVRAQTAQMALQMLSERLSAAE